MCKFGWKPNHKTGVRVPAVSQEKRRGEKKKNVFSFMVKKNGFWRQMTI